jgi:hypothetical protein
MAEPAKVLGKGVAATGQYIMREAGNPMGPKDSQRGSISTKLISTQGGLKELKLPADDRGDWARGVSSTVSPHTAAELKRFYDENGYNGEIKDAQGKKLRIKPYTTEYLAEYYLKMANGNFDKAIEKVMEPSKRVAFQGETKEQTNARYEEIRKQSVAKASVLREWRDEGVKYEPNKATTYDVDLRHADPEKEAKTPLGKDDYLHMDDMVDDQPPKVKEFLKKNFRDIPKDTRMRDLFPTPGDYAGIWVKAVDNKTRLKMMKAGIAGIYSDEGLNNPNPGVTRRGGDYVTFDPKMAKIVGSRQ